jgi:hypothetical protein
VLYFASCIDEWRKAKKDIVSRTQVGSKPKHCSLGLLFPACTGQSWGDAMLPTRDGWLYRTSKSTGGIGDAS